jgi:glycosyltransferase involved in cell wall biosynthesis
MHFIGARNDLDRFYRMLDVFVLPSHYEGLPLALLEAMACECAIVTTAVGQIPTVLDGSSAAIVAAGDTKALAQAMIDAVGQSRRDYLRARVVENYSVAHMTQRYATVYQTLWNQRGRPAS